MSRRDIMVKLMEVLQEWEDDSGIELSIPDEHDLAERIYFALGLGEEEDHGEEGND